MSLRDTNARDVLKTSLLSKLQLRLFRTASRSHRQHVWLLETVAVNRQHGGSAREERNAYSSSVQTCEFLFGYTAKFSRMLQSGRVIRKFHVLYQPYCGARVGNVRRAACDNMLLQLLVIIVL